MIGLFGSTLMSFGGTQYKDLGAASQTLLLPRLNYVCNTGYPPWPLAGFVLGSAVFKSPATHVNIHWFASNSWDSEPCYVSFELLAHYP